MRHMKNAFNVIKAIVTFIAFLVSGAGLVLTLLGVFEMVTVFSNFGEDRHAFILLVASGLLRSVDLFLISMVFYVLSLGMMILFTHDDEPLPVKLPQWLRIRTFIQLKVILWEAVLTTLVISFLTNLVSHKIKGEEINTLSLLVPAGILFTILSNPAFPPCN